MKPHLRKAAGIWICRSFYRCSVGVIPVRFHIGHGYTPLDAYLDWERQ